MKTLPQLQAALPGWIVRPYGAASNVAYCLPPDRRLSAHRDNYLALRDAAGSVSGVISAGAMLAPIAEGGAK